MGITKKKITGTVIFSGMGKPDPEGATAALQGAGFDVVRMSDHLLESIARGLAYVPGDEFLEASKFDIDEEDVLGGIREIIASLRRRLSGVRPGRRTRNCRSQFLYPRQLRGMETWLDDKDPRYWRIWISNFCLCGCQGRARGEDRDGSVAEWCPRCCGTDKEK